MRLTLVINLDNAAFDVNDDSGEPTKDTASAHEVRTILRSIIISDVERGDTYTLRDSNGNTVGHGKVTGRRS